MAALRVLAALTVLSSAAHLPSAAAEVDILQLGGLFDNESSLGTMMALQRRNCLPKDFTPSKDLMAVAKCGQRKGCPGAPRDAVIYECLAMGTGLISGDKFNQSAYNAFIEEHTTDPKLVIEKRLLADACLTAMDTSLTGGQQAVHIFSCWQWSLLLDCDLHETGEEQLSGEASCRRASFLAGHCPLSPPAMLEVMPGVAAEYSWEECAAAGLDVPDSAATETECRQLDTAAIRLVSCRLQQYADTDGKVELHRLMSDVSSSRGDAEVKQAMLAIVKECSRDSGSSVQQLVVCWAGRGIMSCAASEAAQRASEYKTC